MTASTLTNSLHTLSASNALCKAFGIKLSGNAVVPLIARNAGFHALFIDLEHSNLSLDDAGNLCTAGTQAGITPFVRVPYQCGAGFVQRVLDGGAMGVIFPHVHSAEDARAAVRMSKYPPQGTRSMTGMLPQLGMSTKVPLDAVISTVNESGSTVFAMIESGEAVDRADEIAAVDGVDIVLIGSSDLSINLGVGSQFTSDTFRAALRTVSEACKRHGKIFGLAGIYDKPDIQDWAINELGVRFMLVQQDISLIAAGGPRAVEAVPPVKAAGSEL